MKHDSQIFQLIESEYRRQLRGIGRDHRRRAISLVGNRLSLLHNSLPRFSATRTFDLDNNTFRRHRFAGDSFFAPSFRGCVIGNRFSGHLGWMRLVCRIHTGCSILALFAPATPFDGNSRTVRFICP